MVESKRKTITKKTRFEVFKRDGFTCQYCGKMAPDVVLEVDHINPVANGGENDIMNLVTSCFDCNRGKGKRKLTEKDEIKKQQARLTELNEKREQLKMMLEWRKALENFSQEQLSQFLKIYENKTGYSLTEHGEELAKKWIKDFGLIEVLECLEISYSQYYKGDGEKYIEKVFNYIPRIAVTRRTQGKNPYYGKQNYIKAIVRNRVGLHNEGRMRNFLQKIVVDEDSYEEVLRIAKTCRNWTEFWIEANDFYGGE